LTYKEEEKEKKRKGEKAERSLAQPTNSAGVGFIAGASLVWWGSSLPTTVAWLLARDTALVKVIQCQ